ncbi:MAG: recombination mediator RecR [Bacteroidales bacterium]|nr:recombination mediator RecR [Bacteroidales bacterium]MDD4217400.1 recombination mediator RecR [Bacteroidales bacterium]MDY0141993.1 recombination mediator RecR [Bacteroidales bacterium]
MNYNGKSSKLLDDAISQFSSLPGIGKKTATRFALFLLRKSETDVANFVNAIQKMKQETKFCKICNNISDNEICTICTDNSRNKSIICVVEGIHDVMAIESTSQYNGLYHVLGGVISPMDGIGPKELSIAPLIHRINSGSIKELILALSTTMEGDTTNFYINRKIANFDINVTLLARGVAIGDELQFTDEITLGQSILNRKPFNA